MEFGLSEAQRLLAASVRRWAETALPQERIAAVADAGTTFDADIWRGLSDLGATGILVPERHGGSGLTLFDACLVQEELGRAVAPAPFLATAILAPLALIDAPEALAASWLPAIAAGERRIGVGLGGAVGGHPEAAITLEYERACGRALFVLDGDADAYILAADDVGGAGRGRQALILVERDDAALEIQALVTVDRTRAVVELTLDGAKATVLTREPASTSRLLAAGRTALAADTLGAGQTMIDRAVAYALERKQFDRVIGSFQAVKHLCAEMAAELEPCRSLVWYAAHSHHAFPQEFALMACHAKAHTGEVGRFVARTATEVHGGMGFTHEMGLHYWFKRIEADRQLLGGPERVREDAARLQGWSG